MTGLSRIAHAWHSCDLRVRPKEPVSGSQSAPAGRSESWGAGSAPRGGQCCRAHPLPAPGSGQHTSRHHFHHWGDAPRTRSTSPVARDRSPPPSSRSPSGTDSRGPTAQTAQNACSRFGPLPTKAHKQKTQTGRPVEKGGGGEALSSVLAKDTSFAPGGDSQTHWWPPRFERHPRHPRFQVSIAGVGSGTEPQQIPGPAVVCPELASCCRPSACGTNRLRGAEGSRMSPALGKQAPPPPPSYPGSNRAGPVFLERERSCTLQPPFCSPTPDGPSPACTRGACLTCRLFVRAEEGRRLGPHKGLLSPRCRQPPGPPCVHTAERREGGRPLTS